MTADNKNVDEKKIETLCTWDDEYMSLEKEYQKKWVDLQQQFEKKQQVWLDKRTEYLSSGEGKIEKFWLKALQNFPALEDEIKEWDEEPLSFLTNIKKEDLPDESGLNQKGFKLIFEFAENPFFENKTLVRVFHTICESEYVNENTIDFLEMEEDINWKAGKDVTVHKVTKKAGGKKKGNKGPAKTVEEPRPSFFRTFFRTINLEKQDPEELMDLIQMHMQDEEMEQDEDSEREFLEMIKEEALAHGVVIKDNIIPFAVRWYTGEALPEVFDDGAEEEEDDYEDGEELDDEDVSSEEEDKPKGKKAKGGDLFKADKAASIFSGESSLFNKD